MKIKEIRTWKAELRAETPDGAAAKITGYAALYDSLSVPLPDFRPGREGKAFVERIAPGAFKSVLAKSPDVRGLFNHNPDYVLGRTTAGTLRLVEDERGLKVEFDPPDTQWARDLVVSMKRGDLDQMSFGFFIAKGGDSWGEDNGVPVRTLHDFDLIDDVSIVTYPAYPETMVEARSKTGRPRRLAEKMVEEAIFGDR